MCSSDLAFALAAQVQVRWSRARGELARGTALLPGDDGGEEWREAVATYPWLDELLDYAVPVPATAPLPAQAAVARERAALLAALRNLQRHAVLLRAGPGAEAEVWRLDPEDLLDIGRQNLRASRKLAETVFPLEQGTRLKVLTGDSYYAASHALFLDQYLRDDLPHGVLVGIPKRDMLLLHEIRDMGLMEAVTALLQLIVGMHRDGPGSLSPCLYWYHDGEFTVVPYEMDDDTLTLVPPEEFVELMDDLAEFADLS